MKMLAAELILVWCLIDRLVRFHGSPPLKSAPTNENEIPLNEAGGFMHIDELKKAPTGAIENIDHDGQKTRTKGVGGVERTGKQFTRLLAPYQLLAEKWRLATTGTEQ